jgi:transposase-like protein
MPAAHPLPNRTRLLIRLRKHSNVLATARSYGVNDSTVREWMRLLDIKRVSQSEFK